jgi:hypothetical protein
LLPKQNKKQKQKTFLWNPEEKKKKNTSGARRRAVLDRT